MNIYIYIYIWGIFFFTDQKVGVSVVELRGGAKIRFFLLKKWLSISTHRVEFKYACFMRFFEKKVVYLFGGGSVKNCLGENSF
jgi:hypothetical protein